MSSKDEKSKDCRPEPEPETCSSAKEEDPCREPEDLCPDPCPPCPEDPCPPPKPYWHPEEDPRKMKLWRMLSLLVGLPAVVIMSVVTYLRQKEEPTEPRQPYEEVPYMYRRTKPFPWGDGNHSLFHNPAYNPVPPHGYEVEDPYEVKMRKKAGN